MNNEDKILKKLDNHEAIFSEHNRVVNKQNRLINKMLEILNDQGQILKVHSKLFVGLENKLINHDEILERLMTEVVKLRNDFIEFDERVSTKSDINELNTRMDEVIKLVIKFDQEMVGNNHRVGELDETVQSHTKDILILKKCCQIA